MTMSRCDVPLSFPRYTVTVTDTNGYFIYLTRNSQEFLGSIRETYLVYATTNNLSCTPTDIGHVEMAWPDLK